MLSSLHLGGLLSSRPGQQPRDKFPARTMKIPTPKRWGGKILFILDNRPQARNSGARSLLHSHFFSHTVSHNGTIRTYPNVFLIRAFICSSYNFHDLADCLLGPSVGFMGNLTPCSTNLHRSRSRQSSAVAFNLAKSKLMSSRQARLCLPTIRVPSTSQHRHNRTHLRSGYRTT